MCAETTIEWTATRLPDGTTLPGYTFNPWEGCQKVGPGCDNCYAEARNIRFTGGANWGPHAPRRLTSADNWRKPIKWNKQAAKSGIRRNVFCASLADVMDNHASILPEWRDDLAKLILATPHLNWLLLTKRIGNAPTILRQMFPVCVPSNLWLGITVVNQTEADRDIPKLLATPAAVRFLSVEPLLGPLDLTKLNDKNGTHEYSCLECDVAPCDDEWDGRTIDWVIVGGESGPNARPMHPDWARAILQQCETAGVAGFYKQWGEWLPFSQCADDGDWMYHPLPDPDRDESRRCKFDSLCIAPDGATYPTGSANQYHRIADGAFAGPGHMQCFKVGKARAGRLLDAREWNQMPGAM